MSADPLDTLLEKLSIGDSEAAEKVFLAYEPYLRMVVRRHLSLQLRAKFDSVDIVQSIWADLLKGFRQADWHFTDTAHLRAFLVRLTRHRFIDRLRQHQQATEREQPLAEGNWAQTLPATLPQPGEVVQAEELWQQVLELCPPQYRELLRLKREGISTSEVAARVGLHEGSVRRILGTLWRRLARRQQETDRGGRKTP